MEKGQVNRHGQQVKRKTRDQSPNHRFAKVDILHCTYCGHTYGANSCDAHERKCPKCQDGLPGFDVVGKN